MGAYAGWSGSFPADVVATRLANSLRDLELPSVQVVTKWLPGFITPAAPAELRDEVEAIVADFDRHGMRPMVLALAEADLRAALPQVTAPTLLIWGEQDVRSPVEVANSLRQAISGSRLVVLPAAGHLTQLEAADRFNAELRIFFHNVESDGH